MSRRAKTQSDDTVRPETEETTYVVIIGAGPAGIAAAIALKEDLHFDGFIIYEKSPDGVGGVWRGCGSDVPGHWYSLSRALNPHWTSYYPAQGELQAYYSALWARAGLQAHTRCGTEVVRATWDATARTYVVELEDTKSRTRRTVVARVVINASGGFQAPRVPEDLLGSFEGPCWHSARWRHDVPLGGKRVGVVGNGCSAAQFVPLIARDPSVEVINFCRSPQWYTPRLQFDYPGWAKWVFAHVPFAMWVYRAFLMGRSDLGYLLFRNTESRLQRDARKGLTQYIKGTAPEKYHAKLIPQFPPGCKRLIVDPGYLECLHRPNVTLTFDAIDRIVPQGVQLKTGEVVPLDVLIFGTGFELASTSTSGSGPEAYYGLAVPNFPNYFMFLGPNSAGGHASVIFIEEVQAPYPCGDVRSVAVREEASAKYNSWLQARLARSVWNFCDSYYRRSGENGKITVTFPGPVSLFWWFARKPRCSDYEVVGGEERRRVGGS
ncbi:FAD/NAD(P)-binding domain-containing protein [Lactarius quietus]|nr:FAD/NAD(P)-binding domain-containing protein [Lactarius quietus]